MGRFEIEEFDSHPNSRFHNANDHKSLKYLIFERQLEAATRVRLNRLGGADEAAAQGNVRGYTGDPLAGFQGNQFGIGSERVTDRVTAIADATHARHGD